MDDTTRIADALVKLAGNQFVTWRQALITGVALAGAIFTGQAVILSAHSDQPHPDAVSQAEFTRTLSGIADDLTTIRIDVRELRNKGG